MKYLGKRYGEHRCTIDMEASPGGGLPNKLDRGRCSSEILKEPLRGTKIQFCGRGLNFRYQSSSQLFFGSLQHE